MATACFSQAPPLILVLVLLTDAVSVLPAPGNVRIRSINLRHIVQWDPVKVENVTYRVEYRSFYGGDNDYLAICKNTTQTEYNFTGLVPFHWSIVLRVRAEVGNLCSRWHETPKFQATRNTTLGPVKSLSLSPGEAVHDAMSVSFEPPISREILPHGSIMTFSLRYWKSSSGKVKEVSSTNNHMLLKDLDSMTLYCVEVTASVWNRDGEPSETVCEKTSAAPALTATGYIWLVVGLVCACCVISVGVLAIYKHSKIIKKLLFSPSLSIPYDIEKFLQDTSSQGLKDNHHTMESTEEHYDNISIVELGSGYDSKDFCTEECDLKQMPDEMSAYQTDS